MIKIKLNVKKENYEYYRKLLIEKGFEIDNEAFLSLIENDFLLDHFYARKDGSYYRIEIEDIFYFESYGHDIYLRTSEDEYKIKENLRSLEYLLDERYFLRINGSNIVNIKKIKKIKPILGTKLKLTLTNDICLIVSRTYYYKFTERIKI